MTVWTVENTDGEFVASFATKLLADFFVEEGSGCYRHRTADNSSAIGEHAFRAGWEASERNRNRKMTDAQTVHQAWSAYTPPDDLCGG